MFLINYIQLQGHQCMLVPNRLSSGLWLHSSLNQFEAVTKLQPKLYFSTVVTTKVFWSSYESFREDICKFFPVCWFNFLNIGNRLSGRTEIFLTPEHLKQVGVVLLSAYETYYLNFEYLIRYNWCWTKISSSSTKESLKTLDVTHRTALTILGQIEE